MPKIPDVTAEPRGGRIPSSPDYISAGDAPGAGLARTGAQLADSLTKIGVNIAAQRNDIEYANVRTNYETHYKATVQNLETDPEVVADPSSYERLFVERMRDGQEQIRSTIKSSLVGKWFNGYVAQKYPGQVITAKGEGLKLQGKASIAGLDTIKDDWSKLAAEAETIEERESWKQTYAIEVGAARERGFIDDVQAGARVRAFNAQVLENQSVILANGGSSSREELRSMARNGDFAGIDTVKLQGALATAASNEEKEERTTRAVTERASQFMMNGLTSLAGNGALSDEIVQPIINNENPLISPAEGLRLKALNEKAPNNSYKQSVGMLLFNLDTAPGPLTRARVEQAKRDLNDMVLENGPSQDAVEAGKYLNSLLTSVRTTEAQELQAAGKYAEEAYKSQIKPMPGFIRNMVGQHNREVADMAEINKRIRDTGARSPEAVTKIIEDVRKRREAGKKDLSEKDKLLKEALPK